MENITLEDIDRYIYLNNELSKEDKYVLRIDKESLDKEFMIRFSAKEYMIFILSENSEDVGFISLRANEYHAFIERIFLKINYRNKDILIIALSKIKEELIKMNVRSIKYIGVMGTNYIDYALNKLGFKIIKEHIQMEKEIKEEPLEELYMKMFKSTGDCNWIYNFIKDCMGQENLIYSKEDVENVSYSEDYLSFIVYNNEMPAGFIIAEINALRNNQEDKRVIYIEEIGVHKNFRQKGLATNLISNINRIGARRGLNISRLHVYRDNLMARKLYKKLNYNDVKSIAHWLLEDIR